jgi:AcrR family transcriptional regulator
LRRGLDRGTHLRARRRRAPQAARAAAPARAGARRPCGHPAARAAGHRAGSLVTKEPLTLDHHQARDRLLDAALRLFHVGVDRIIAEAGVAPMTLYRHFGGKDQLLAAALEQWSAEWLQWLGDRLDRDPGEPGRSLAALWDALGQWFAGEGFRGSLVANAVVELRGDPGHPAHRVVAAHRMAVRQLLDDAAKLAGARTLAGAAVAASSS